MRLHVVQTADSGELDLLRNAARDGRAAAMSRRRALAAGKSALATTQGRLRTGFGKPELRAPAAVVDATRPAAPPARGIPSPVHEAPAVTAIAPEGVAGARLGRAFSMQRRRQMSQGKQALISAGDRTSAAAGAVAPALVVRRGGAR